MATLRELNTHKDFRGSLTVVEGEYDVPFEIKRIYYIYDVEHSASRGGHRHIKTSQALICLRSQCTVFVDDGKTQQTYVLNDPAICLILQPEDWHTMENFTDETVLLVLASEHFDAEDYVDEGYT